MSRDVRMLTHDAYQMYLQFAEEMAKLKISFVVTSVDRSILEQMALYVQGRMLLSDVNRFRVAAGLPLLGSNSENKTVTWTLDSKHVVNPFDSVVENDRSRAFDIVIVKGGKAEWNLKVDTNMDLISDYEQAGAIWRKLGGVWGGDWKRRDCPHFEHS